MPRKATKSNPRLHPPINPADVASFPDAIMAIAESRKDRALIRQKKLDAIIRWRTNEPLIAATMALLGCVDSKFERRQQKRVGLSMIEFAELHFDTVVKIVDVVEVAVQS